jgi:hypothetical protein
MSQAPSSNSRNSRFMTRTIPLLAFLAALVAAPALPAAAQASGELPSECRRFSSEAQQPRDFAPRLARLCVRLIDAHDSQRGMSPEERDAATRLGHYLAVLGELDLRRGAVGISGQVGAGRPATQTARYLIAYRIGLLEAADRLAPHSRSAELH